MTPRAQRELENTAAPGISYFTPLQDPPAGAAYDPQPDGKPIPKVFQPIRLRGVTLQNRVLLSPLCQYSADDGHYTMWGWTHMGGIVQRGPGLSIIEAAAVMANGRITPQDVGIWKDSQIEPLRKIVEFAHSQNQHIAIQLAHAGRKASCVAPWIDKGHVADKSLGGWPDNIIAPTGGLKFDENYGVPREMTKADIAELKASFVAAAKRSVQASFDVIEIHSAHGYLLHEFLSGVTNKRTDEYGGPFANRIRLLVEVVEGVRAAIPDSMPLFVRISASDWLEETDLGADSWTLGQSIELAKILAEKGVDFLDVSSAGNHPQQKIKGGLGYQAHFAKGIKEAVGDKMAVGTVGAIVSGKQANELLESGIDAVLVGRMFQKNPGLVFAWADELETAVNMPNQIRWGFGGRGRQIKTGDESKQKI